MTCNCDSPNPYMGPWHAIGCCTLYAPSATYTESDMRVLTEAALRLGRKEAMEEFAATLGRRAQIAERVPEPMRSGVREGMVVTWIAAQRLAEDAAYLAAPDASEPRTDPGVDSDLPPEPQAVRSPQGGPDA